MLVNESNEILQKKQLLTVTYFELQRLFEKKYGSNALVLMEVGTFFEVYEVNNDEEKIGKAKEISEILNIQLTRKNKNILENSVENPLMAGVPAVSFDKHLARIVSEQKYTIAVVKQRGVPPNVSRYLDVVISPGTNFDFVQTSDENFLSALVIDKNKDIFSVGYSAIDVTTGKCYYSEVHSTSEDKSFALDEAFNYMNMYKTSEVVLSLLDKSISENEIVRYLELSNKTYHIRDFRAKIAYQNELFKNVFGIESLLSPIEHLDIETAPLASESLAFLIDFVIEHDSKIIEKLLPPTKLDVGKYVYLGNNALEQLNIIETPHNISLQKIITQTSTAMGKRLLKERLTNPIKDYKEILRRQSLSIELFDYYNPIDKELAKVYDIARLGRRIRLNRLHPFELNYLYDSLFSIKEIVKFMENYKFYKPPCSEAEINGFLADIDATFDLFATGRYMLKDVSENMIKKGINPKIDELVNANEELLGKLELIQYHICKLLGSDDFSLVQINRLDKEGFFISLTKNRFYSIKEEFDSSHVIVDDELLLFKNFKVKIQTNNVKITNDLTQKTTDQYAGNLSKIIELNKQVFKERIGDFDKKYSKMIEDLVEFIAEIDVTVSNIKVSKKYNFVCPKIVKTKNNENFLEIIGLRHPIIEQTVDIIEYVPNDVVLGDLTLISDDMKNNCIVENSRPLNILENHVNGILLYGINSAGKSSLMKAVGISVILAQAGFFVPAKSMRFSIFESMFTRISGSDNISKGLSSFAVEMMELKNIFNRAGKKSLILGDEISHSTETMSGVSIVASAILKLSKFESLFIFATHLHQLTQIDEIARLRNVMPLHLSVYYQESEDKLIFDRKLKYGQGSSIYGLEFAKSLHIDAEFLKVANEIRKKISDESSALDRLKDKKTSKYNKNLYLVSCAICGEAVEDVHHRLEQSTADEWGFIGHVHKNQKSNLIPLCKLHHKMVHDGQIVIEGFISTSKGVELKWNSKKGV
ncbi:MAG: DNA mismatch repair protein [Arcobacteraceae bacterium]|nr:DNA mismatch repair protein [Arcobacteraceae bacterium]